MTTESDAEEALAGLGRELELRASRGHAVTPADEDDVFRRAAALRDNAMGIIYDGDGSSDQERVARLLTLIPSLLTVVDEARDTIQRLRELSGEQDPAKAISPYDAVGRGRPEPPNWGEVQKG